MDGDGIGDGIGDGTSDVIVVGAGVVGLTSAIRLAERGLRVLVWSRDPAAGTTSAVAGALWWPYRIEPEAEVGDWSLASLRVYEELAADPTATGVRLVPGVHADTVLAGLGDWARRVPGLRQLPPDEVPGPYEAGLAARLPLVDMPVHLEWLRARAAELGVRVERRAVGGFAEAAAHARTVVDCAGLGARELAGDGALRAVRGQLVLVENPGVDSWFTAADKESSETTYFFPQPGRLILGGTAEEGVEDLVPDPATAARIVARCSEVRPEIAGARVLGHRVGLRPARAGGVRNERDPAPLSGGGMLVHNYGHGGAGVTVAWGCADRVAELVTGVRS
ncbi:FAD-dependent oxidoreductase [Streptomyces sp. NPDC090025]|uniref:FAD-dependent oxidoreductase n=1 Tax=Streptomyces sp. NPDC090025 TaxID=3365922 RepID=UPI0038325153